MKIDLGCRKVSVPVRTIIEVGLMFNAISVGWAKPQKEKLLLHGHTVKPVPCDGTCKVNGIWEARPLGRCPSDSIQTDGLRFPLGPIPVEYPVCTKWGTIGIYQKKTDTDGTVRMGVFKGDELLLGAIVKNEFGTHVVELIDIQGNSMIKSKAYQIVFKKGIGPLMKSLKEMVKSVVDNTPLYDLEIYPGNGNQRYEERTSGNIYEFGVFKNGGLWLGVRIQPFNGNPNLFEVIDVNKEEKSLDGKGGRLRGIHYVCVEQESGMDGRLGKNDHGNVFQKSELSEALKEARTFVTSLLNVKELSGKYFDGLDEK